MFASERISEKLVWNLVLMSMMLLEFSPLREQVATIGLSRKKNVRTILGIALKFYQNDLCMMYVCYSFQFGKFEKQNKQI